MASFKDKLWISAGSAFLFTLVNLPQTYKLTDNLANKMLNLNLFNNSTGCPTNMGLILHALVFFVITYLSMGNPLEKNPKLNNKDKVKHSLYGTLIFFLIASPAMYALTNMVLGSGFANANGCPTLQGVVLHAIVYCAALVAVMYL